MTAALEVLQPSTVIDCVHYGCKLSARACVLRQNAAIKNRYGVEIKAASINSFCVTGECEQGRDVAIALIGQSLAPPRRPSGYPPRLKLVSPAARSPGERRRVEPISTLPPAAIEEISEDLDEAFAPPRVAPPTPKVLEERRAEVAAAVLERRAEEAAVRPAPSPPRRRRRQRDPLRELCRSIGSYISARIVGAIEEVLKP